MENTTMAYELRIATFVYAPAGNEYKGPVGWADRTEWKLA
jgi:hypothetical protein